jgi:ABC-type transporter Mla MlaB component
MNLSFDAYTKAAQQFSIADAQLMNKNTACAEIDRVLTAAITLVCHTSRISKQRDGAEPSIIGPPSLPYPSN